MSLPSEPLRSSVVLFLSLSLLGSALLSYVYSVVSPTGSVSALNSIQATMILEIAAGTIVLIFWAVWRPDYSTFDRPLGITILALGTGLAGVLLSIESLLLLFLPVIGIIGLVVGGIGLGFFYLARGLWMGEEWSVEIMQIISAIGVVTGIVLLLLYGTGAPLFAAFQLWYLRRPHLRRFFYDSLDTKTPRAYGPLPITD